MSVLARTRTRDIVEVTVGFALILTAVWTPLHVQRIVFWLAFSWILSTTLLARDDRDKLGLGVSGLYCSLWVVGAALILALVDLLISIQYGALHPLYGPVPIGRHMWGYMIWAVLQQFVLQDFFLLRLLRLLPSPSAAIVTAAMLFSIAHIPNPLLTIATLAWGTAACFLFLKYRNLYVLGIAHGILGLCIAVSVPNAIHHHMRVGLGYLRYSHDQRAARAELQQRTAEPATPLQQQGSSLPSQ
ncbi:MAG: CPBP family intramembrane glutamate endopeptidase [Acidobacteriaceae bacterium]